MNKYLVFAALLVALISVASGNETTTIDGQVYVITPHGLRLPQCVIEVPHNSTVSPAPNGQLSIKIGEGAAMIEKFMDVPEECHKDVENVRQKLLSKRGLASVGKSLNLTFPLNGWLDNAGWYPPSGENHLEKFSSTYVVPSGNPRTRGSQVLFYFIGMQDNDSNLVNIVQPVLTWGNGMQSWYVKSWICCPSNITVSSPPITGLNTNSQMNGVVERINANTWRVDSEFNGQHTTLNGQVGPMNYNWADVTLEVYSITACPDFASGSWQANNLNLVDQQGQKLNPGWTYTGATACGGNIRATGANSIAITHSNN